MVSPCSRQRHALTLYRKTHSNYALRSTLLPILCLQYPRGDRRRRYVIHPYMRHVPRADCYLTDDSTYPASSQLPFVLGSTIHTYIPSVYPPIFAYHPLWSPFIISPPSLNTLKALEPCIHSIQLAPTSAKHVVQPVPLSPSYNHSWITRYGSTCLFTPFLLLVIKVHLNF